MNVKVLAFSDAIDKAGAKPHVLLGNGFSIACAPNVFNYGALLDEATFTGAHADIKKLFGVLGSSDFERIIQLLRSSAAIVAAYGKGFPKLASELTADADLVRDALANVLAARHPDNVRELPEAKYVACRTFLSNFERIYTLNYDMLLYWTVMQTMKPKVSTNDGFGDSEDETDLDYVVWQAYKTYVAQRIFYLHGSLHLYDSGTEISKITWSRTDVPLITQIRDALDNNRFPLVVTEGSSQEKVRRILHNAYLNHAIRSFSSIGGSLFIYGHSLAPNDDHILSRIEHGNVDKLFVSLYGDPTTTENRTIVSRARGMSSARIAGKALSVQFFDAGSAHVWG